VANLIYPRERAIKILHKVRKHMLEMQKSDKQIELFAQPEHYAIMNYFRLQGIEEWISLELLLYDQQQRKMKVKVHEKSG